MNLKQTLAIIAISGTLSLNMMSCKSKVSDSDLKSKVETAVSSTPGVVVDVKEGVVTLNGTVSTEAEKTALEALAKGSDSKNVKSLVNNIVVAVADQIQINSNDADLVSKIVDITKDFPQVTTSVKDGVITVNGTVEQSRVQVLKQALDALNPKRVDMSALTIK